MRRMVYVVLAYFGFSIGIGVILAGGVLADWLRNRADRKTCDRHREAMTHSWAEQRAEIQALPEWVA